MADYGIPCTALAKELLELVLRAEPLPAASDYMEFGREGYSEPEYETPYLSGGENEKP